MNLARAPGHEVGSSPMSDGTPIVFVVDDDVSVRESLELLIRCEGWQPEIFASAQEFLSRPRVLIPSCLVLDVSLPGLNGLDLQKRIASDRIDMPIIFITGHGDIPMSVQAMKAGAVEFLTKPFGDDVLLSAIRNAIERSQAALGREAETRALRDCYESLTPRERQVQRDHGKGTPGSGDAKDEGRLSRRLSEYGRKTPPPRYTESLILQSCRSENESRVSSLCTPSSIRKYGRYHRPIARSILFWLNGKSSVSRAVLCNPSDDFGFEAPSS